MGLQVEMHFPIMHLYIHTSLIGIIWKNWLNDYNWQNLSLKGSSLVSHLLVLAE